MLFTPQLGWAYQILKIETGGDCQSTWYGNASFRAPFYSYENPSICQDRLGTSIGEVEKRDACFAGGLRARSPTRRRTLVQKSPFGAILYFEKMMNLPRQARDRQDETLKTRRFPQAGTEVMSGGWPRRRRNAIRTLRLRACHGAFLAGWREGAWRLRMLDFTWISSAERRSTTT
jgi:hypothetical protein